MDVADAKIEHEFLVGKVRKIEVLITDLTSLDVRVLVGVGLRKTRPQMSIDVTCVREMDPKTINKQIILMDLSGLMDLICCYFTLLYFVQSDFKLCKLEKEKLC